MQLKFYKEHRVYSIKYFKQHNKKNNLKDKNLTKNKYCLEKIKKGKIKGDLPYELIKHTATKMENVWYLQKK